MRDDDRAKVYRAEQAVRVLMDDPGTVVRINGISVVAPEERKFGRVEDIQTYVDKVLEHVGCGEPITVRVRKGQAKAHYERAGSVIAIPEQDTWAMREVVVLHDIAHHLTDGGHGPDFRSEFCGLLEKVLAPEARFMMQLALWSEGVSA